LRNGRKREADYTRYPHYRAAQLLHKFARGFERPTGGNEIIDNYDPLSGRNGVGVHLQSIGAVFQ